MSSKLRQKLLESNTVLILDGGMGTELDRQGVDLSDECMWSTSVLLSNPEAVSKIHESYAKCGCHILSTATYQLSEEGCVKLSQKIGKSITCSDMTKTACALLKSSTGPSIPFIGGSLGPLGAILPNFEEYIGSYDLTAEELLRFHRPRIDTFFNSHGECQVDSLLFETFPKLNEALVVANYVESQYPKSLNYWITFTLQPSSSMPSGLFIADGTSIFEVVTALAQFPNLLGIGVNCCNPIAVKPMLEALLFHAWPIPLPARPTGADPLHIVLYPNSGEVYAGDNTWTGSPSTQSLLESATTWVKMVREHQRTSLFSHSVIIGGCCRTTPQQLSVLRQLL